jgi:hypothetical protein
MASMWIAAGTRGAAEIPAPSPYGGKLAKAIFMSSAVGDGLAALVAGAPAADKPLLTAAAERARQPEPALASPRMNPANPRSAVDAARLARRRVLAQGLVALVATPEARAESVAASDALVTMSAEPIEDAQGIGAAQAEADMAEGYLKAHRDSALTPYLHAYLMVQYRILFENQAAARAVEGQKASARKYRVFRQRGLAAADPLVKAVAQDIDAQIYLRRPTAEHPKDYDPDACCRDK